MMENRIQLDPFQAMLQEFQLAPNPKRLPFIKTNFKFINGIAMRSYAHSSPIHAREAYYMAPNPKVNLFHSIPSSTSCPTVLNLAELFKELIKENQSERSEGFAQQCLLAVATLHELPRTNGPHPYRFVKRLFNRSTFLMFSHEPSKQEIFSFTPQPCSITTPYLQSITKRTCNLKLNIKGTDRIRTRHQIQQLSGHFLQQVAWISTAALLHPKRPLMQLYQMACQLHDLDHYQSCIQILLMIKHALPFHRAQTKTCAALQHLGLKVLLKIAESLYFLQQLKNAEHYIKQCEPLAQGDAQPNRATALRYTVARDNIAFALTP